MLSFYRGQVLWQVREGTVVKRAKSASSWSFHCGVGRESEKRGTKNPSTNWGKAMKEGYGELFSPNGRFVCVKRIGEGFLLHCIGRNALN